MAFLEIKNISKKFGDSIVLDDLSIKIEKGNFFSFLGPSGCGKTTLLRIIAGLESPDAGQIILDGIDITDLPPQKRNIGIVFQNYALFPHMTVFDNIAYGLKIKKLPTTEINKLVAEVLEKVHLLNKKDQNISLLSGGEQQRVSLARAIVMQPQLILFDEPLSNLDYSLRIEARNEIKRLQNEIGITSIYVTHDQSEALSLSDTIAVLQKGIAAQIGTSKEVYFKPANKFVAEFVGHYNFFDKESSAELFKTTITDAQKTAVLPEHVIIHKTTDHSNALIKDILFAGSFVEYIINYKEMIVRVIGTTPIQSFIIGENILLSAAPENIQVIS
ncbi:MAG TPA: ABC transporter ATP-binding protein [Ferruginibacter sp.]|nr:ABC transporter ATP-binding protein [Ferruginibacter sp.]